jgi:diketogulonate reductase-like aldo/keto reductase
MTVPGFLYGTAWKEDATEHCVANALAAGFRGIDTANQRKHYFEAGVGRGIARSGLVPQSLFLQTKFTFAAGQDSRLPFDPRAPIGTQVAQSFASSLEHLGAARLDSLVLHGPSRHDGLGPDDHEAWRAMEALAQAQRVTYLGISNVTARQLRELLELARVPVTFVQNRCYADRGWDREVRALCRQHGVTYQGFSLLTANRRVLANPTLRAIAARHRATPEQVVLRFAQQIGMLPLTGTKDPEHMRQDLAISSFELAPAEVAEIEEVA